MMSKRKTKTSLIIGANGFCDCNFAFTKYSTRRLHFGQEWHSCCPEKEVTVVLGVSNGFGLGLTSTVCTWLYSPRRASNQTYTNGFGLGLTSAVCTWLYSPRRASNHTYTVWAGSSGILIPHWTADLEIEKSRTPSFTQVSSCTAVAYKKERCLPTICLSRQCVEPPPSTFHFYFLPTGAPSTRPRSTQYVGWWWHHNSAVTAVNPCSVSVPVRYQCSRLYRPISVVSNLSSDSSCPSVSNLCNLFVCVCAMCVSFALSKGLIYFSVCVYFGEPTSTLWCVFAYFFSYL